MDDDDDDDDDSWWVIVHEMVYGLVVAFSKSWIVEEVSKALSSMFHQVQNTPLLMFWLFVENEF